MISSNFANRFNPYQGRFFQVRVSAPKSNMSSLDAWLLSQVEAEGEENDDLLEECQVCFEIKPPWKLGCGHQLCKTCCVKVIMMNQLCPFDRQIVTDVPTKVVTTRTQGESSTAVLQLV